MTAAALIFANNILHHSQCIDSVHSRAWRWKQNTLFKDTLDLDTLHSNFPKYMFCLHFNEVEEIETYFILKCELSIQFHLQTL